MNELERQRKKDQRIAIAKIREKALRVESEAIQAREALREATDENKRLRNENFHLSCDNDRVRERLETAETDNLRLQAELNRQSKSASAIAWLDGDDMVSIPKRRLRFPERYTHRTGA